jgi:hypothetical protein
MSAFFISSELIVVQSEYRECVSHLIKCYEPRLTYNREINLKLNETSKHVTSTYLQILQSV